MTGNQIVVGIDSKTPSVARVWDSLAGGKDNFAPDREIRQLIEEICPGMPEYARDIRGFLKRAVAYAAGQGIDQFIDLGAGLPHSPMPHETARRVIPGARFAYVDSDPQVTRHLTAWYGLNKDGITVINADVADHAAVLGGLRGALDLSRPCCVILSMMLHFFDAPAARALTEAYLDAAAPGSYLVVSSAYTSRDELREAYSAAVRPCYNHPPEVFATLFGSAELIPPGVGEVRTWYPGLAARQPLDTTLVMLCAVARKS